MQPWEVFISYAARDPDWPQDVVNGLAEQLRANAIGVRLDSWHRAEVGRELAPDECIRWMDESVRAAAHVLCLCSPLYRQLSEGGPGQNRGYGVAFEAFELVLSIYRKKQRNEGWLFGLVHAGHSPEAVMPAHLDGRLPIYRWEEQRPNLLRDLAGLRDRAHGVGDADAAQTVRLRTDSPAALPPATPLPDPLAHQCRAVVRKLEQAPTLLAHLLADDFEGDGPATADLAGASPFVRWLAGANPQQARKAMRAVARALADARGGSGATAEHSTIEAAACAIYLLAVCRWIDLLQRPADLSKPLRLSSDEPLYCAMIVTLLVGGELVVESRSPGQDPAPAFFYQVKAPAGSFGTDQFERALYQSIFAHREEAIQLSLLDRDWTDNERAGARAELLAFLDRQIKTHRRSVAITLHAAPLLTEGSALAHADLAALLHGRVIQPDPGLTEAITGVPPPILRAEIHSFWSELGMPQQAAAPAAPAVPADAATLQLRALVAELQAVVQTQSATHTVQSLQTQMQQVLAALEKPPRDQASKTKLREACEGFKASAEVFEGGGKIADVAQRLLSYATSFLT